MTEPDASVDYDWQMDHQRGEILKNPGGDHRLRYAEIDRLTRLKLGTRASEPGLHTSSVVTGAPPATVAPSPIAPRPAVTSAPDARARAPWLNRAPSEAEQQRADVIFGMRGNLTPDQAIAAEQIDEAYYGDGLLGKAYRDPAHQYHREATEAVNSYFKALPGGRKPVLTIGETTEEAAVRVAEQQRVQAEEERADPGIAVPTDVHEPTYIGLIKAAESGKITATDVRELADLGNSLSPRSHRDDPADPQWDDVWTKAFKDDRGEEAAIDNLEWMMGQLTEANPQAAQAFRNWMTATGAAWHPPFIVKLAAYAGRCRGRKGNPFAHMKAEDWSLQATRLKLGAKGRRVVLELRP